MLAPIIRILSVQCFVTEMIRTTNVYVLLNYWPQVEQWLLKAFLRYLNWVLRTFLKCSLKKYGEMSLYQNRIHQLILEIQPAVVACSNYQICSPTSILAGLHIWCGSKPLWNHHTTSKKLVVSRCIYLYGSSPFEYSMDRTTVSYTYIVKWLVNTGACPLYQMCSPTCKYVGLHTSPCGSKDTPWFVFGLYIW